MSAATLRKRASQFAVFVASPYIVGVILSWKLQLVPINWFEQHSAEVARYLSVDTLNWFEQHSAEVARYLSWGKSAIHEQDRRSFHEAFDRIVGKDDPLIDVSLSIHLNGNALSCATSRDSKVTVSAALRSAALENEQKISLQEYQQYNFDSFLTSVLSTYFISKDQCTPPREESWPSSFSRFCDAGPERTPILPDHGQLIPYLANDGRHHLPCRFHTREGVRILSLQQLASHARQAKEQAAQSCIANEEQQQVCPLPQLEIYAVQAGRLFIFAPKYLGEIFHLPHVHAPTGSPVYLQTLSLSPRVFEVKNFYSEEEADAIVHTALTETAESHKMRRSSTGATGYNLNSMRTSENAFVTHSAAAVAVKERCFSVLGFEKYDDSFADGLQVLRYNVSTAYTSHLDWIDDYGKKEEHDFDSEHLGTNRFATIFLYMSDLPDGAGGETVFPNAWPTNLAEEDRMDHEQALEVVRKLDVGNVLKEGSWEEQLAAHCRSKLAVQPAHHKAILFYSQHPDGKPDQDSLHGACPVLDGTKWGANLWVWNGPRGGYPGAPVNRKVVDNKLKNRKDADNSGPKQLLAVFTNTGNDPSFSDSELYFQDSFWGKLGHGDPSLSVNTYEGHQWNVKVNGAVVKTWIIDGREHQDYVL